MKKLALTLVFGSIVVYFAIGQVFLGGRAIGPPVNPGQLVDSNTFMFAASNLTQSVIRAMPWPVLKSNIGNQVIAPSNAAFLTAIRAEISTSNTADLAAITNMMITSNYSRTITSGNSIEHSLFSATNPPVARTISAGANVTIANQGTNLQISSSGSGSASGVLPGVTNYGPNVNPAQKTVSGVLDLEGTNTWTFNTATNFEFSFSGTAEHGQTVTLMVSNPAVATRIIGTNLAGIYDLYARSNRTTWEFESNAITIVDFTYDTNFNNGTWTLSKWAGPEYALEASGGVLLSTNGATRIITAKVNPVLLLNTVFITNGLQLDGPFTNSTDSYLDSTHVATFDASGTATFNNEIKANAAFTFSSTNMIPSGNLTNFRAYYDRPVHTYLMTNGFHLTGVVNVASADLWRGIIIIGRNYSGGALPASADSTFRRAGTNYVSVGNNQFFRMSVLPDGTGGVNPTNHGVDLQVYDSP